MGRIRRFLVNAGLILCVAAAAIAVGLLVTPMQTVSTAGQTLKVGVAAPSWSISGPGELDLFGQRIPTVVQFAGPVRPRLKLTQITLSKQLREFVGTGGTQHAAQQLEAALVHGWERYFYWQVAVVALVALLLLGGIAGWLRRSRRRSLVLVIVGLLVTEAINLGAIMTTAYTAPQRLSHVDSLAALAGESLPQPAGPPDPASPRSHSKLRVVVIGDSTAAGLGLPPVPHPTANDRSCNRSTDSYAADLADATDWHVTNLACSGATIATGLLGPLPAGSRTVPAQLGTRAAQEADVVIVSIGANDVHWTDVLAACAISVSCDNNVERAYFQNQLAGFSRNYLQLLTQLQVLPRHPQVVVNLYYDPLTSDTGCLHKYGISDTKVRAMQSDLIALNSILRSGAQAASMRTVQPNFDGHGLCSHLPYVQGISAKAPFHPTATGELAIALADEHAITAGSPSTTAAPTPSSSPSLDPVQVVVQACGIRLVATTRCDTRISDESSAVA